MGSFFADNPPPVTNPFAGERGGTAGPVVGPFDPRRGFGPSITPEYPAMPNDPNSLASRAARGEDIGPVQHTLGAFSAPPTASTPSLSAPSGAVPRGSVSTGNGFGATTRPPFGTVISGPHLGVTTPPPFGTPLTGPNAGVVPPGARAPMPISAGNPPAATTPSAGTAAPTAPGAAPPFNPHDPTAVDAWLRYMATQPGIDPSVGSDPGYWRQKILSGELGPDADYIIGKMTTANQGGGPGGGSGGLGAFLQPFTGRFSAPTGTDDPGFQFAVQQGQDAIQRSAAAKGNLLTGGTLKDLASYTTGAALQDYSGAYNRAANTFGMNYDIFRNNQTDPYNKLMGVTQLGYNAAAGANAAGGAYANNLTSLGSSYANNLGNLASWFGPNQSNLTTGIGNSQAAGTVAGSNALSSALAGLAQNYPDAWNWFRHQGGVGSSDGTA